MPLPRFNRLSAERRQQILAVARDRLAKEGLEAASYSQIVADAGISRTSAYLYFDGRDDVVGEVLRDSIHRAFAAVGPWRPATSAAAFWDELRAASARLEAFVSEHPADMEVLRAAYRSGIMAPASGEPGPARYLGAILDNGMALGLIRKDVDPALLARATAAVFMALDGWALAELEHHRVPDIDMGLRLLEGLWSVPLAARGDGR